MKKPVYSFVLVLLSTFFFGQNYTWVRGSNTSGISGNYGAMGVPAATNDPGGRHGCAKWVDAAGNLWLFGGEGYSNSSTMCWMNDLWKYTIATNEWTWIRGSNGPNSITMYGTLGVASATNEPGAREFPACWTDASGNLWLFGGDGYASNSTFGRLGDLWKYNPSTNQWTWMSGFTIVMQNGIYGPMGVATSTAMPGCRYGTGTWTDAAGNFWMFGGRGLPATGIQGYLNDLWKYNPGTNQWTWVTGTNITNQYGLYGSISVPSTTNAPGGRYFPACWMDASSNIYMFGGLGFAASATNSINDLWKYDPIANTWTWIGGSSGISTLGIYGTQGISNPANIPGARFASAYWKDASGNFWLFGGNGFSSTAGGELNDLFRYNPSINEWTWVKGSTSTNQNGTYGTMGIPAPANTPGARIYNTWWKDLSGTPWIFGGEGYDISSTATNHMNDLWKFKIPCSPDSIIASPANVICSGSPSSFTAVNGGASTVWYTSPTSTNAIANGSVLSLSTLTASSSPSIYSYYAEANYCTSQPRAALSVTVNPAPTLTTTTSHTLICKGESNTLTVSGANSYSWNTVPVYTSTAITVSPTLTTIYSVTGINSYSCSNSSTILVKVVICISIPNNSSDNFSFLLYPNPNTGQFKIEFSENVEQSVLIITDVLGEKVYEEILHEKTTHIKTNLPSGIYYYNVLLKDGQHISGKFVIKN